MFGKDGNLITYANDCPGIIIYFDDTTVSDNTPYSYIVVPIMDDGSKGLDSNTLVLRTTNVQAVTQASEAIFAGKGRIVVKGFVGEDVVIATADGNITAKSRNVPSKAVYSVGPGIYLVKAGKTTVKLIVR